MSKYIKTIPLSQIERVQIYINKSKKTLAQIKTETGADYLLNGGLYEGSRAVCHLKVDGVVLADDTSYQPPGYAWDAGADIAMVKVPAARRNYISCCQLIVGGRPEPKLYYNPDVGGSRERTAMGIMGDKLCLYCTNGGRTPEGLRDELAALGWDSALMLDGGGSSQCDFAGERITASRRVHNLILVYLKKGVEEPPKEEEDCMSCADKLVKVAMGELGTSAPTGDDQYISWYNGACGTVIGNEAAWCAIFVSWCARHAGVCPGAIPNYHSCTQAVKAFRAQGVWRDRGAYTPKRGDLIFFDWDREPSASEHTGIVTGVSNGLVQTVEGNSGKPGAVRVKSYALTSELVLGYAAWAGEKDSSAPPQNDTSPIKTAQAAINERYKAGLSVDGSWGPASKVAAIRAVQTEINRVYKRSLTVDGSFGPATKAACPTLRQGTVNDLVWVLQVLLTAAGYALDQDGSFGPGTAGAVTEYRKDKGLGAGSMADASVFAALVK